MRCALVSSGNPLGLTVEFTTWFGTFHGLWLSTELTVDYTICKLLKIPHEEAHLLTAGMEVGRKLRLLEGLLKRSDYKNKDVIIGALRKLQNETKRNVFAHSYLMSDEKTVTFVHRSSGQKYTAEKFVFTMPEFKEHMVSFAQHAQTFWDALEMDKHRADLEAFGAAAMSAANSSKTSPVPPSPKA
jgi:hypothetical protein